MGSSLFHIQRTPRNYDDELYYVSEGLDIFFFLDSGSLVFGSVRKKNARSVVVVHFLDASISAIAFYLFGFGFAYGEGGDFLGTRNFALHDGDPFVHAVWFSRCTFGAIASAIVTGAVAERMRIEAKLLSTLILTIWVCPVVMHWVEGGGWLLPGCWND